MKIMSIKGSITPEMISKFQDAIDKTKEIGEEHGFYICENEKGFSLSKTISGKDRRINLGDPVLACKGKKIKGNFHTHSYLTLFKKKSKFMESGMSDEEAKDLILKKHGEHIKESGIKGKQITIDSPSPKDLLTSILYNCIGKSEGIMCVGSDMGNGNVECWTPNEIPISNCDKAYNALYSDSKEKEKINYESWMIPLFHKEVINLKKENKLYK